MLKLKKRALNSDEKTNLLSQKAAINAQLEQNRVLGIKENEKFLNKKLEEIENTLKKENIVDEPKNILYGGVELDSGNLKDKSTEELLRIQTIQMYKLLQKSNALIDSSTKSTKRLKTISDILTFWLVLSILSLLVGIIFALTKS